MAFNVKERPSGFRLVLASAVPTDATERDELRQRLVGACVVIAEPDCYGQQRNNGCRGGECLSECQPAYHSHLEDSNSEDGAIRDDRPCPAGGMLIMVHGVQELILVSEIPDDEIEQPKEKNVYAVRKNAVHDADDEDQ